METVNEKGGNLQIPRVGQFATVRNRRGVVAAVEPYDGPAGRIHLVHVDFKDDQLPVEEQLLVSIGFQN